MPDADQVTVLLAGGENVEDRRPGERSVRVSSLRRLRSSTGNIASVARMKLQVRATSTECQRLKRPKVRHLLSFSESRSKVLDVGGLRGFSDRWVFRPLLPAVSVVGSTASAGAPDA